MGFSATDGELQLVDVPEDEQLRLSGLRSALSLWRLCILHLSARLAWQPTV